MSSNMRKVRVYAEKRGQQWQAFCIDLNLAAQGDTLPEVLTKLKSMVRSYVDLAMAQNDPKHQRDMLYRPAPLSLRIHYWYVRARFAISGLFTNHNDHDHRRPSRRYASTFTGRAGYC